MTARTMDRGSVAGGAAGWRVCFLCLWALLQGLKWWLAWRLPPFSDEAFYWQESRHLAWGYSDLPGMTAWLIHLGQWLGGPGLLAMRAPFLILGASLPWLVRDLALQVGTPRQAWQAGLYALALPLASSLGVLALPDVPLTVAMLVVVCALARLGPGAGYGNWLVLGLGLAVACCSHYRAAPLALVGLGLLLTPTGRRWWRQPGAWLALLLTLAGLWPMLAANLQMHGAGLAFQLWQRNPWRYHADALVQPLEQAAICTPLLYGLLAWAGWQCWRRRGQGWIWQLLTVHTLVLWLGYAVGGLFADDSRFRLHWPLPAYLPLLAVLPVLLATRPGRGWRWLAATAWGLGLLVTLAGISLLGLAAGPGWAHPQRWGKVFPTQFTGWPEAAARLRPLLRPDQPLVADNFILGAELDFALAGRRPVYVMDSPLNAYHGRAPQLAAWGLDLPALRRQAAGRELLLVVDESALRERWRWPALARLCGELATVRPLARLDLDQGRRRFAYYAVRLAAPQSQPPARRCVIWQAAHTAIYPAAAAKGHDLTRPRLGDYNS